MSISYPPIPTPVATGVNTTILTATVTSSQIIAPNPARTAGSMIVNNSNRVLWITLAPNTASASVNGTNSIPVPANGGNYAMPATYQGAVQGAFAAGVLTGTVQFIEPYV